MPIARRAAALTFVMMLYCDYMQSQEKRRADQKIHDEKTPLLARPISDEEALLYVGCYCGFPKKDQSWIFQVFLLHTSRSITPHDAFTDKAAKRFFTIMLTRLTND